MSKKLPTISERVTTLEVIVSGLSSQMEKLSNMCDRLIRVEMAIIEFHKTVEMASKKRYVEFDDPSYCIQNKAKHEKKEVENKKNRLSAKHTTLLIVLAALNVIQAILPYVR